MTQNNVLMLTVATTIATAAVEMLVELGRNQLTADLFHLEGAEAAIAKRHLRRECLGQLNTAFMSAASKPSYRLPVRKRSARHV